MVFYNPLDPRSAAFPKDPRKWPKGAEIRSHFGQRVLWLPVGDGGRHVPAEDLEKYRQIGDPAVDRIFELRQKEGKPVMAGEDLLLLAEQARPDAEGSERALYDLYQTYSKFPSWTNEKILAQGQETYLAYLPSIGMSLYYRSLVPGFSIPRIAAVLESTGYLSPPANREQTFNRLMDTGLWMIKCFESLDNILPGGKGWKACLQVRFLHAKVRHGLLRRKGNRAWQIERLGIPINEEDMNATLLAFAVNPLLGVEMLLGFPVPESDRLAYLAVWRYLGWLLGVPVDDDNVQASNRPRPLDPCGPGWNVHDPDPLQHSYAVFQSIILHLLHPDASSVRIANHLLWQGRKTDASPEARADEERWYFYRSLQCRRFVGNKLADALELSLRPTWWGRQRQYIVSNVYLIVLTVYSWLGLPQSPFRQWLVRWHRGHLGRASQTMWTGHEKRMKESLSGEDDGRSQHCPFAMVSPPIHYSQ